MIYFIQEPGLCDIYKFILKKNYKKDFDKQDNQLATIQSINQLVFSDIVNNYRQSDVKIRCLLLLIN